MKLAVRFVVFRLCVPVNACSVEFASVGLPNGNQFCVVPSSKSFCIGPVRAPDMVSVGSADVWRPSEPAVQPSPYKTTDNTQPRNIVLVLI